MFLFFHFVRSLIEIPVREDRTRIEKSFGTFDDVGYRFLGRFTIAIYRILLYFYISEHGHGILLKIVSCMVKIFRAMDVEMGANHVLQRAGFDDSRWYGRRIKERVYFRDKIVLNSMDKFDIHGLLSFDLYFTIVINQLKFETTSWRWFLKKEILERDKFHIVYYIVLL